ncbi:MAG: VanZ family protein [Wenzhouxiangella sp.]
MSAPMHWAGRWLFRLVMLALVTGLILPPDAIDWLRDQLSVLLPLAREVTDAQGANVWAHFLLFFAVSFLSFWFREDIRRWQLSLKLVALALVMEGVQLLVDGRFGSWFDVGINLSGVAAGALLVFVVKLLVPSRA